MTKKSQNFNSKNLSAKMHAFKNQIEPFFFLKKHLGKRKKAFHASNMVRQKKRGTFIRKGSDLLNKPKIFQRINPFTKIIKKRKNVVSE